MSALERRMVTALTEAYEDLERHRVSALGVRRGLGDRHGIIRLTIADVARICCKVVAREART
jgi:hypothetical protein